jgi:hypothetical protein
MLPVAGRDESGWSDVRAKDLEEIKEQDFEEFCFDLVKQELYDRHRDPPLPDGPVDGPDGGRDFLITVKSSPFVPRADYGQKYNLSPLTEDPIHGLPHTRTAYSCKSGKNWLDLALVDARERGERVIEVLLEGGFFKLLLNVPGKLDEKYKRNKLTPREHLVGALWDRLKEERPDAEDPGPRIEIIDANSIADFLRARHPGNRMDRWARKLELTPFLQSLEDWRDLHKADRQEPAFEEDGARAKARDELIQFLRSEPTKVDDRIACIVGPPGVGKTRLVLNMLSGDPALAQRVRVAFSPDDAIDALQARRMLRKHPNMLLIVDDCLPLEADRIAVLFHAAASALGSAHLLVLVPASDHGVKDLRTEKRWLVAPLDEEGALRVVAAEMGRATSDADVIAMAKLSEGFPWFARLLAVEARSYGRAPRDMKEALRWALASRQERGNEAELKELRERRAKSLLAASLTRAIDWDRLSPEQERAIADAVSLESWDALRGMARECHERGILRRRLDWHFKYVTPQVLEREIVAWLLGPDGTDPGGRKLARHGEAYFSDFLETLEKLNLPATLLKDMASIGFEDLCTTPLDWKALRGAGLLGTRLRFLARRLPGPVARELRRRTEATALDDLRTLHEERRGLVHVLHALTARRDGFEDAEVALFRLALAENESYQNNATGCWAEIFLVELNETYLSLDTRLHLLERRLEEAEPAARLLALAGIGAVLATQASRIAIEPVDGPWPIPTPVEARQARARAWGLLAERFADPGPGVASRAKKLAYDELRGAIHSGLGDEAMAAVAAHIADFSDVERGHLREKLEEMRIYDDDLLDPEAMFPAHLEQLLAPTSFQERLHQHVGFWGPTGLREDDEARDDALALEGLAGDPPALLGELDWIVSDEAQRAHMFAYAMGRRDKHGVLLAGLHERARTGQAARRNARLIFARYLGAWSKIGGQVDVILRDMQAKPDEAPVLAMAIFEVGATSERLTWIKEALRDGTLDASVVRELTLRRYWLADVGDDDFASLIGVLVEGAPLEYPAAALDSLVPHIKQHPSSLPRLEPLLLRAVERLASVPANGMTNHHWEQGATMLMEQGRVARVAELAVIALERPQGSNDFAWATLHRAAERDAKVAWKALSAALERRDTVAGRLLIAFRFHRKGFVWPRDEVLAWVGSDERRARTVVALVRPYAQELDPILRALIERFGAHSSVAREIVARVHSTDGMTPSLAGHDAAQLTNARRWLADRDPAIAEFAKGLVESLEQSYEHHAAYEEDERRRYGT